MLENAAVIFVDLSDATLAAVRSIAIEELKVNAEGLARCASALGLPSIITSFPGGGEFLSEVTVALPDAIRIERSGNNCWTSPEFVSAVESLRRKHLIFAGIALDVGVGLPARSALQNGYQVSIAVDACGAISEKAERVGWMMLSHAGASLSAWSSIIAELQGDFTTGAGTQVRRIIFETLQEAARHGK